MDFWTSQKIPRKIPENPCTRRSQMLEVGPEGSPGGPRRPPGTARGGAAPSGRLGASPLLWCPTDAPIYSRDGETPKQKSFSQFSSRSPRHPLFFSGRANLEVVLASGEGRSSPSSSSSPLHPPSMTSPSMCEQFPTVGKVDGVRPDMRYCSRSRCFHPDPRTKHISQHYRYKDTTSHTI